MKSLNYNLLESGFEFPEQLQVPASSASLPEKVIQFGEGNFLRAFADWFFHRLNEQGLFNGRVVVVQPLPEGFVSLLNEQDGLYTLLLRGLHEGAAVQSEEIVGSVSRGLNPYTQWAEYLRCAENPEIQFVISNTTEAGIVFDPGDSLQSRPPRSFPGKLLAYLYHRFQHFAGERGSGMVLLPCELIERNGDTLKEVLLRLAAAWALPAEFNRWLKEENLFLNTLVDRVVTGYPEGEAEQLAQRLGYRDRLLVAGERFHLWVIEGPAELKERLPFAKAGLNVIWTDDLTPYRTRKVRILNGAHTAAVPAAFLYGLETVGEMVAHPLWGRYTRELIYDEIIPSIGLETEMLQEFAGAVWERFHNPYLEHRLQSILLNSVSKFTARVLPSIEGYCERRGLLPPKLSFSLAALIALYRGRVEGAQLRSHREKGPYLLRDDPRALELLSSLWVRCDCSAEAIGGLVEKALGSAFLWGRDLNEIPGLARAVAAHLELIMGAGLEQALLRTMATGRINI